VRRALLAFRSMGCECSVRLESCAYTQDELDALASAVRGQLELADRTLTRFDAASELSALNRDPRAVVPASPLLAALARAAGWAGDVSGGLVDATRLGALEALGYDHSRDGWDGADLDAALAAAPARRPARPDPSRDWASVHVDASRRVVRPPGVRLDSGGLAKGLAADLAGAALPAGVRFAIGCGGDLVVGPGEGLGPWDIDVAGVRGGAVHRLRVRAGGIATSGVHTRLWRRDDGSWAHHLLDPATGEPAWTGLLAVTAVGVGALEAEVLAKTALLSGPAAARRRLRRLGGVLQHDDGRVEVIAPAPVVRLPRPVAA
jgi:thiamine biosynthesis lipoprotein